MRATNFLLGVLLASIATACSPTSSLTPGCYEVELSDWSAPFPSGWTAAHEPPRVFRLDSQPLSGGYAREGHFQVHPNLPAFQDRSPIPPRWTSLEGDTTQVLWSNGFVGVVLLLQADGEAIHGKAIAFYDDEGGQGSPTAAVTGRRVQCADQSKASGLDRTLHVDQWPGTLSRDPVTLAHGPSPVDARSSDAPHQGSSRAQSFSPSSNLPAGPRPDRRPVQHPSTCRDGRLRLAGVRSSACHSLSGRRQSRIGECLCR